MYVCVIASTPTPTPTLALLALGRRGGGSVSHQRSRGTPIFSSRLRLTSGPEIRLRHAATQRHIVHNLPAWRLRSRLLPFRGCSTNFRAVLRYPPFRNLCLGLRLRGRIGVIRTSGGLTQRWGRRWFVDRVGYHNARACRGDGWPRRPRRDRQFLSKSERLWLSRCLDHAEIWGRGTFTRGARRGQHIFCVLVRDTRRGRCTLDMSGNGRARFARLRMRRVSARR